MLVRAGKASGGTIKKKRDSTPGAKMSQKGAAESSAGEGAMSRFFYSLQRMMEKNFENRIGHDDDEVDWCM
jgi:hypothetical protein